MRRDRQADERANRSTEPPTEWLAGSLPWRERWLRRAAPQGSEEDAAARSHGRSLWLLVGECAVI